MKKRLILLTLAIMLVLGGLVAGLFSGSIQKALTLPMMTIMDMATTNGRGLPAPAQPAAASKNMQKATPTRGAMKQGTQGTGAANALAQDTFQRTNQLLWGQSSDGRTWEGDANTQKSFAIQNATGQITGTTDTALNALLGPAQDNVNVLASGSVSQFSNDVNFGVVLRYTDARNWYKAFIDGKHLNILKRVQGQSTLVRSVPFVAHNGHAYSIRFQSVGAMLFTKVWRSDTTEPNTWMVVTSDMDLANGKSGLRVVVDQGTIITVTSFVVTPARMDTGL